MNIELQTKVAEAIFYGSHGDPIKDFISEDEIMQALMHMFTELYGKDAIKTLLEDGEWERYGEKFGERYE